MFDTHMCYIGAGIVDLLVPLKKIFIIRTSIAHLLYIIMLI